MNDTNWPDHEKNPNAEEFRKLFVGGLPANTSEETLKDYFSSFGPIELCEIMKDRATPAKSKGFGFLTFSGTSSIDEIQKNRPHRINDKEIETKRATPKQQQYWPTKKLYIRNFPKEASEDELVNEMKDVFSKYGNIVSVKLIKENQGKENSANSNASLKGFGFIEFDDEDPVDKCNLIRKFKIKDSEVYVSKAYPQEKNSQGRGRGGNYYFEDYVYPYEYFPPAGYGGRPYGRYSGRNDYYGYDYYHGGRNYSRGGGGGRPYRGRY